MLEIHEDEWRRVEWLAAAHAAAVEAEYETIRQVLPSKRDGPAFRRLRLRQKIVAPLGSFGLDDLRHVLGACATWLEGIGYEGLVFRDAPTGASRQDSEKAGRNSVDFTRCT